MQNSIDEQGRCHNDLYEGEDDMIYINKKDLAEGEQIEYTTVDYMKLYEDAITPTRGSAEAAGYDLYARGSSAILPHQTHKVGTGIAVALPTGTFGAVFARSGLATKEGLRPANCVGVIDSDYRGEIIVALHNDTDETKYIKEGERVAQLVVIPYLPIQFYKQHTLDETQRGDGGFGSTGK